MSEHELIDVLALGNGQHVAVCNCGWASPNLGGQRRAKTAHRRHAVLAFYGAVKVPATSR